MAPFCNAAGLSPVRLLPLTSPGHQAAKLLGQGTHWGENFSTLNSVKIRADATRADVVAYKAHVSKAVAKVPAAMGMPGRLKIGAQRRLRRMVARSPDTLRP